MTDPDSLAAAILRAGHGVNARKWPDRRGEYWMPCPLHGGDDPEHFSFGPRGYNCFVCGGGKNLGRVAEALGVGGVVQTPRPRDDHPKAADKPVWTPAWKREAGHWRRYLELPPVARDYYHSRGIDDGSIRRWRLGWGVLPASRCALPRAVLPVFAGGKLVAVRGRAVLPEDRDEKWLQAAGSEPALYGAETLRPGGYVVVAEAPYSVILFAQEYPEYGCVASSSGVSIWRPAWTEAVARSRPRSVVVAFDNDEAGRRWGPRVRDALRAAGLAAKCVEWPLGTQEKGDLADAVGHAQPRGVAA